MNREKITTTILELEERASAYERILNVRMLERCNLIVQVGPMTLTTNERNEVVPQMARFPTQFSEEGVRTIMDMTFYNGKDEEVKAEVFGAREWYLREVSKLRELIDSLQDL
ncbi:MAG: hypothetical protein K9J06_02655 [Flavobacteriales bacterium]|nr:hypothetical protein [Flavobacteriales bacterium]